MDKADLVQSWPWINLLEVHICFSNLSLGQNNQGAGYFAMLVTSFAVYELCLEKNLHNECCFSQGVLCPRPSECSTLRWCSKNEASLTVISIPNTRLNLSYTFTLTAPILCLMQPRQAARMGHGIPCLVPARPA